MPILGQDITLFNQFNGQYDYLAIGNTLNEVENNLVSGYCETLSASSAELNLPENATIISAYLYWAGSGNGDTEITLNNTDFIADNTYTVDYFDQNYGTLTYFSCYKEITDFIINNGEITYELSNLDITQTITQNPGYCNNSTNFSGWCIYVIYEDAALPLNQINLFQGLEIINRNQQEKTITLENINVLDNEGAKIGFLTWEGDANLNYGESLFINNNLLSNPPLNPADNAFNGTNSFTNSNELYNCDIDYYNIQNYIAIGDETVDIKLTTGAINEFGTFSADLIIINNIITVLNSQLPDATVNINNYELECGNRNISVDFTVFNNNSTDILPENTPIAVYANNTFIHATQTNTVIDIGESETQTINFNVPEELSDSINIQIVVDDIGNGTGIITELNEANNSYEINLELLTITNTPIDNLEACDEGFNQAFFDLTSQLSLVETNGLDYSFYTTLEDLQNDTLEIINPSNFQNTTSPQTIYLKVNTENCYKIFNFSLNIKNCPPTIPEIFTPNNDGYNDWFNIQGLYNIFENHKLLIYNRYGTLIFEGNNDIKWDGKANKGINNRGKLLPTGTYFYVLYLNDRNFDNIVGWVYLNR
ncbi:gliding motility-associated C-terminal domain-containing protein [Mangrovimonas cancribranchiae]|uniref:Gliding motility-associated C-terminal domain-containing protein n=1 Tax=Mangrovimonas cancribranchiae TaxID=3080055 RepID=A0AAU6P8B1_9FLAO